MTVTTEQPPGEVAAAKVAELEATVAHWTAEEAAARAEAAAAQERLDSSALDDAGEAYGLIEGIAAAEGRAAAAASLAASAARRLNDARTTLLGERAVEQRAVADELWADYRAHELRRRELLQQVVDFDHVGYAPTHHTGSKYMLDAAKMADEAAAALEVEAFGESAVLRPEVPGSGTTRRTLWIGMAGPVQRWPVDRSLQRFFRVTVDGQTFPERLCNNLSGEPVTWIRREFPAGAVVAIEGKTVRFVDDPGDDQA